MSFYLNKVADLPRQEVFPGIVGHLVHTDHVSIGDFRIAAGTELPQHHHPHEQTSTVLAGQFRFDIGGEVRICGPGDVAVIPGNVSHGGVALTECHIIDVFAPVREDYRL
ncbi:cupin domain-containing protein [Neolewinella lacunae]|uniref:Cupin domain-containing protein n=1 Tax=Neolewinella lacunae TaxID=1517758 RepID=A0A923PSC1_9BACT|nr:cupin domain-containing protein [Neolewinella lacunae]MBC6996841.1 cupin domain-containing protein [Neolewinella lacunae]MDN3633819.1 cupin domain-containing protein [Neolewinella lacunae]